MWIYIIISSMSLLLAQLIQNRSTLRLDGTYKKSGKLILVIVILLMAVFGGIRTNYNDTHSYLYTMNTIGTGLDTIKAIIINREKDFGFYVLCSIIKTIFGNNGQWGIFFLSFIFIAEMGAVFWKYSAKFSTSLFLFISLGIFLFGYGAVRQGIAMFMGTFSILLWTKNKKKTSIVLFLLTITIHYYSIFLLPLYFLTDKTYSKKTLLFLFICLMSGLFYEKFINLIFSTSSNELEYNYFLTATGVNIVRLMVHAVLPILAFQYRKEINEKSNKVLNVCCNASFLNFGILFIASFGAANMFARMSFYFLPLSIIGTTYIMESCMNSQGEKLTKLGIICLNTVFFFAQAYNLNYITIFN